MKLKPILLSIALVGFAATSPLNAQNLKIEKGAFAGGESLIEQVAGKNDYYRCASFSLRVLNACIEQANRQGRTTRPCRQHYQNNMVRCQALNR